MGLFGKKYSKIEKKDSTLANVTINGRSNSTLPAIPQHPRLTAESPSTRPGTPPPGANTIARHCSLRDRLHQRVSQDHSQLVLSQRHRPASGQVNTSNQQSFARRALCRSTQLESSAVTSATNLFRDVTSRSICSRYSINTTPTAPPRVIPQLPSQDPNLYAPAQNMDTFPTKASVLPPINNGSKTIDQSEVTSDDSDDEYEYVLKTTQFSRAWVWVKKSKSNTDTSHDNHVTPAPLNPPVQSNFANHSKANKRIRKVSITPSLPTIPENILVNHVSKPFTRSERALMQTMYDKNFDPFKKEESEYNDESDDDTDESANESIPDTDDEVDDISLSNDSSQTRNDELPVSFMYLVGTNSEGVSPEANLKESNKEEINEETNTENGFEDVDLEETKTKDDLEVVNLEDSVTRGDLEEVDLQEANVQTDFDEVQAADEGNTAADLEVEEQADEEERVNTKADVNLEDEITQGDLEEVRAEDFEGNPEGDLVMEVVNLKEEITITDLEVVSLEEQVDLEINTNAELEDVSLEGANTKADIEGLNLQEAITRCDLQEVSLQEANEIDCEEVILKGANTGDDLNLDTESDFEGVNIKVAITQTDLKANTEAEIEEVNFEEGNNELDNLQIATEIDFKEASIRTNLGKNSITSNMEDTCVAEVLKPPNPRQRNRSHNFVRRFLSRVRRRLKSFFKFNST